LSKIHNLKPTGDAMVTKSNQLDFAGKRFFIGIDVHKKNWTVTIQLEQLVLKTFSINPSPQELYAYMRKNYSGGTWISVYEAGYSGFWIHRELCKLGFKNIVVNPADVPTTNKEKDRKDDPIDSRKLCREVSKGSLCGIYIPDHHHEALRVLSRTFRQYTVNSTRTKNWIKSLLSFLGVDPGIDAKKYWSAASIQKLYELKLSEAPNEFVLRGYIDELKHVRQQKLSLLRQIRVESRTIPTIKILRSVPGLGLINSFTLYSELVSMERFSDLDHLASMVGLVPSTASSSDKTVTRGLTHRQSGNLRSVLIEAAWVAARMDPALTHCFAGLCTRMTKTRAIVHIAKKLLNRIRCVWIRQEPYVVGTIEVQRGAGSTQVQQNQKPIGKTGAHQQPLPVIA
jgi:transposase